MLICKTCQASKDESNFWPQRNKRGFMAECKVCATKRNKAWINSNRERFQHLNKAATGRMRRKDPVRAMVTLARSRCKSSGLEFSITADDLKIPSHCPVLGIRLSYGLGHGKGQSAEARDSRASLDRIDNARGYTKDNVVVVSYRANRIKSDANVTELLKVARFYAKLASK